MANILQVTTPNLNTDNRNILNPQDPRSGAGAQSVHNPVDPTRVVRADGRDGEQSGNAAQEAPFGVINYESNYGAFIKGLTEEGELTSALERLLFSSDMAGIGEAGRAEVGALVEKLLLSVRMDSPQDLVEFIQGQRDLQARFTGDFFNKLRSILSQNPSEGLRDTALSFLKVFNDYSSGPHLLQQMHSLMEDIEHLLFRSYRAEFRELADSLDWQAANGETAQNAGLLNDRMIPFLASYISRTHDYGPIREATMLLIFHAVRYQNGNKGRLLKFFGNMIHDRDFARLFKGDAKASLMSLLRSGERDTQRPADLEEAMAALEEEGRTEGDNSVSFRGMFSEDSPEETQEAGEHVNAGEEGPEEETDAAMPREDIRGKDRPDAQTPANSRGLPGASTQHPMSGFADGLSGLLLKGANGQAGLEHVQQFYTIMNGMLLNESVYMPLLHFILPFQYEDNNVMSEMWVDPDARKDNENDARKIKVFLKFDIQSLGKFELLMTLQDHETRMQLLVPPHMAKQEKKIQTEVADILKKNNIRFSQLLIRERVRDRRVDEVFPEIREKERTINVRI